MLEIIEPKRNAVIISYNKAPDGTVSRFYAVECQDDNMRSILQQEARRLMESNPPV